MRRTVLIFGLIGGLFASVMMLAPLLLATRIGFDKSEYLGYTVIVLSFLMVFFGIRSYRDNVAGGTISFGRALAVGLLITAITCACYVISWELITSRFVPNFFTDYSNYLVEKMRASGATQQAINARVEELKQFKQLYDNPFLNAAFTLMEPLPVGLIITLISALILRKKPRGPSPSKEPAQRMVA